MIGALNVRGYAQACPRIRRGYKEDHETGGDQSDKNCQAKGHLKLASKAVFVKEKTWLYSKFNLTFLFDDDTNLLMLRYK